MALRSFFGRPVEYRALSPKVDRKENECVRIFKNKAFARFARKGRIADAALIEVTGGEEAIP
jgi:hypothetical protein